jgi:opacity protein-like surface antigen
MFKFHALFAMAFGLSGAAFAFGQDDVGTTSAAFLKLGSGARPEAMGEAYVGVADDAAGIAFNPAGMALNLNGELAASHTVWFQGMSYENLNGIVSLGDGGMLGATFDFLSIPAIQRTVATGINNPNDPSQNYTVDGSFSPYDMQVAVAYARPLLPHLLGGANFKLINQDIDTQSTFGIALDLGLMWETPFKDLTAGLALQNMGTPIKLESEAFDLPFVVRAGTGFRTMGDRLLLSLEGDVPADNAPVVAAGAEYNIADRFYPRVGYRYNSIFNPWTMGFGLQYEEWGLDFSVVPYGELGTTYRAGINWRFGQPGATLKARMPYASTMGVGKDAVLDIEMNAPDKVQAWAIYIYDSGRPARVVRAFGGSGIPDPTVQWDGRLKDGKPAPEGVYWAILTSRYTTGQIVNSSYVRLEVTNTVPVVDLVVDKVSLNPAAPGEAFVPTAFRPVHKPGRGIAEWKLEILDPQGKVFRTLTGEGAMPEFLVWDGKGDLGDELTSAQVYSARLWVKDPLGAEGVSPVVSFKAVFR